MDELTWEVLTEVQGRMEAEFIKSYLGDRASTLNFFRNQWDIISIQ